MPLGIYISIPFCRSKCSYCNFASDVLPAQGQNAGSPIGAGGFLERYTERLCADIAKVQLTAEEMGGCLDTVADSVYLGGGTPTILGAERLRRVFAALRHHFEIAVGSEITVECAPGTLNSEMLEGLLQCGVNRLSFGVQSFVDQEVRAVGRLHTSSVACDEISRLRARGIENFNLDLIAGLPHQTRESWRTSLEQAVATGTPHVSVYMLEVDEDSRLGREVMAGGSRYHAHFVPDDGLIAELYREACEYLHAAGLEQYEISNFARPGYQSAHNMKYWTRQPYLGFGLDAHSFVPASGRGAAGSHIGVADHDVDGVRFATSDSLDGYLAGAPFTRTPVSRLAAREECFFLGLRLNRGVDLNWVERQYGMAPEFRRSIEELCEAGLLHCEREGQWICLTPEGRLLANEVFERFVGCG